jgi:MOSC domain-containing protein YiiM
LNRLRRRLSNGEKQKNEWINKPFAIGSVRLQGIRLCQPCKYLVRLTGEPGILRALVNRGGLRARILTGGVIRVGDAFQVADFGF